MVRHCCFQVSSSQVWRLGLGDLFALGAGDLADFSVCGLAEPDLMPAAFLIRIVAGGVLITKVKLLVRKGGDHHRDRQTRLDALSLGVERLAELHDVQTALTQSRADRAAKGWPCRPALAA